MKNKEKIIDLNQKNLEKEKAEVLKRLKSMSKDDKDYLGGLFAWQDIFNNENISYSLENKDNLDLTFFDENNKESKKVTLHQSVVIGFIRLGIDKALDKLLREYGLRNRWE